MSRTAPQLIFDLDDTLIESFPGYVALHQRVARELEWPVPTRADLVAYGRDWRSTLRRLWPDRDLEPFCAHYDSIADEVVYGAFPGVPAALERLHERGHSMWIVSKRSRRRIGSRMEAAGIRAELFRGVFAGEDQPAPKPDPRCFAPVWDKLGERRPAIYFGDRHEDRLAAHAAGLRFVAVRTGPEADHGFPTEHPSHDTLSTAAEAVAWVDTHVEDSTERG